MEWEQPRLVVRYDWLALVSLPGYWAPARLGRSLARTLSTRGILYSILSYFAYLKIYHSNISITALCQRVPFVRYPEKGNPALKAHLPTLRLRHQIRRGSWLELAM